MTTEDYIAIQSEAIEKAESDSRSDPIVKFYGGLLAMRELINERLSCADSDGVTIEDGIRAVSSDSRD